MTTRAYSICRRCASVYPEGRRCPACENDHEAGREVAAASTHAVEVAARVRTRPMRGTALMVTGVVALSLVAGFGVLALALI
jgi:hypothetical protein